MRQTLKFHPQADGTTEIIIRYDSDTTTVEVTNTKHRKIVDVESRMPAQLSLYEPGEPERFLPRPRFPLESPGDIDSQSSPHGSNKRGDSPE
jgi:hypothetical protein